LPLTDADGHVGRSAAAIRADLYADRVTFPMDDRVARSECDEVLVLSLDGGNEFVELRLAAVLGAWVREWPIRAWRDAVNGGFMSTLLRLDVSAASLHSRTSRLHVVAVG
jgi:hypothetical protein